MFISIYRVWGMGVIFINPKLIHNQIHGWGMGQSHQSLLTLNEGELWGNKGVEGNTLE